MCVAKAMEIHLRRTPDSRPPQHVGDKSRCRSPSTGAVSLEDWLPGRVCYPRWVAELEYTSYQFLGFCYPYYPPLADFSRDCGGDSASSFNSARKSTLEESSGFCLTGNAKLLFQIWFGNAFYI